MPTSPGCDFPFLSKHIFMCRPPLTGMVLTRPPSDTHISKPFGNLHLPLWKQKKDFHHTLYVGKPSITLDRLRDALLCVFTLKFLCLLYLYMGNISFIFAGRYMPAIYRPNCGYNFPLVDSQVFNRVILAYLYFVKNSISIHAKNLFLSNLYVVARIHRLLKEVEDVLSLYL